VEGTILAHEDIDFETLGYVQDIERRAPLDCILYGREADIVIGIELRAEIRFLAGEWFGHDVGVVGEAHVTVDRTRPRTAERIDDLQLREYVDDFPNDAQVLVRERHVKTPRRQRGAFSQRGSDPRRVDLFRGSMWRTGTHARRVKHLGRVIHRPHLLPLLLEG